MLGAGDLAQIDPQPGPSPLDLPDQHKREGRCHSPSDSGYPQGPSPDLVAQSCGRWGGRAGLGQRHVGGACLGEGSGGQQVEGVAELGQ